MCRGRPDLDVDHMLTLTIPNSGPISCRIENSGGWWLTNKIGQGQIHSFQQGAPLNCSDCFDEVFVPVWHELFDVRQIWTVQTVQCSIDLNYSHSPNTIVPFSPNFDCSDFGGPWNYRKNRYFNQFIGYLWKITENPMKNSVITTGIWTKRVLRCLNLTFWGCVESGEGLDRDPFDDDIYRFLYEPK